MTSPHITIVTEKNFEDEVLKADKLVLIDFYADWCGPCKALAPTLEKFAEENQDVKVVKINVDDNGALAQAFHVQTIPLLVTMKDGQALFGISGNLSKKDLEKFVKHSQVPPAAPPAPPSPQGPTP